MNNQFRLSFSTTLFALLILSVISAIVYYPGLSGAFLLDDLMHLKGLSEIGSPNSQSFWDYVVTGAGPSGRPIAYLSYALQASSWPNAYSFKLVSLSFHVINSVLVFILIRRILELRGRQNLSELILFPLIISALWLIDPIQVSTVHYVIQRMAILSAFWVLLGMNFYLLALTYPENRVARYNCFFAYGLCLICGLMSKENAILLPLLVGTICVTLLRECSARIPLWERLVLLYVPSLVFVAYILINGHKYFVHSYRFRNFDVFERLLTQFNVLADYLVRIVVPYSNDFRLFYENYKVSTSLEQSLVGVVVVSSLLIVAILGRKTIPWIACGILFYFAGHIVESTALSLELYFEHRNYLPSLGIVIAVIGLMLEISNKYKNFRYFSICLVVFWGISLAYTAYLQSEIWGNKKRQAVYLYENNPTSHRAHGHLAKMMFEHGAIDSLSSFYKETIHMFPLDLSKPLLWIELNCLDERIQLPAQEEIRTQAVRADYNHETLNVIKGLIRLIEQGKCSAEGYQLMLDAIMGLLNNEQFEGLRPQVNILAGKALALSGNYHQALYFMLEADKAGGYRVDIKLALVQLYHYLGQVDLVVSILESVREFCGTGYKKNCSKNRVELLAVLEEVDMVEWYRSLR